MAHRGGGYDSAPLLLEDTPDLEELFADPPVIQKPTEDNREFWSSASMKLRRVALFTGYLRHPDPGVRQKTLGLMTPADYTAGVAQLLFDFLAADPDETVRQEAARVIWLSERDDNCEYAVNKADDEITYGSEDHLVGPTRARKALELLVEAAPDGEARKALEHQMSLAWP